MGFSSNLLAVLFLFCCSKCLAQYYMPQNTGGFYLQASPYYNPPTYYQPEILPRSVSRNGDASNLYDTNPYYGPNLPRIRRQQDAQDVQSGRLLSASAFSRISETLGALNTVGRYIVNMTRGQEINDEEEQENIPNAILTLTKNVLGQNVTNTIEPLIKRHPHGDTKKDMTITPLQQNSELYQNYQSVPLISPTTTTTTEAPVLTTTQKTEVTSVAPLPTDTSSIDSKKKKKLKKKKNEITKREDTPTTQASKNLDDDDDEEDIQAKKGENYCRTPDGKPGRCEDLSSCPGLLLDLIHLRESLCFKSLFVPGVCCPSPTTVLTTQRPLRLTTRPPVVTTSGNLILKPQKPFVPTTSKPLATSTLPSGDSIFNGDTPNLYDNLVDPEDCGQQEYSTGRIVGGMEAKTGEWPWMAAIFLHGPKRTEFWCGGSLIGVKYILTAAHCTRDSRQKPFAARQFTVRLGDIDLSTDREPSSPVTYKVKEVRAHPRFSRVGFYNDIAVLVLETPVRKSKYIIPVCLPIPQLTTKERLAGKRSTVVGWGTTYYGGKESTVQRQAILPIWRNEDCNRAYFQPITDNFLCAGYSEGGVDACQGDSGGPLMMEIEARWTQLGIVSFGNKCGEPGYPGVYTRVSEYLDWIKENTKN